MHSLRKLLAAFAGFVLLASLSSATVRTAKAQSNRAKFDLQTVAKRYNVVFHGGGRENVISGVGWFEANENGVITSAKISVAVRGATVYPRGQLELLPEGINTITLENATDGLYRFDLSVGHSETNVRLFGRVLLDDPRGRSGKFTSTYAYFFFIPDTEQDAGVATGEITAQ